MSTGMSAGSAKLQSALHGLQEKLESANDAIEAKVLRPMQKKSFQCSARCCDEGSSRERLQQCYQQCTMPLLEAEQKIKVQMEDFQHRYQRCIQRCQDVAVEKLSATPSDAERKNAEASLQNCVIDCCTQYEKQIPKLQKTIMG
mmetsp:Transcript_5011/g.13118  ORF Transcript_5011/g.13118 Transcript_5011/m.13118 type:complete len:144 (+) Transcript_5011:74-505(+)